MDAVTLLDEARRDGVKIEVIDGDLQIEADASQKHWLRKLKPHKSEILALIDGNGQHQEPAEAELWPEPQPLPDLLPPVAPFAAAMLPEAVRPFVEDVAERMQCPIDFPAIAMMIVLAGVVGRKVAVRPKRKDDWTVVANLWGLVVGRPGLMKTPAISEPMKFLKRLEIEAKAAHEADMNEYLAAEMVAKAAKQNAEQAVKKALKDGVDATEIARQAIEQEQEPPTRRRYQVNDPTVEKLGEILNQNPNGVTLCRDELYAFLRSLDKDGHEAARGFYLEAWNGNGRYCYDRIGRGTIDIDATVVSMIGTIQPSRLAEYVDSAVRGGSGDDGLIQRFQLAVWPDCPSKWRNVDRWPDSAAKNQVFDLVCDLNEMTAGEVDAIQGEDDGFPYLRFAPDAQAVFDDWLTKLETRLRGDELVPAMESHLAKYRSLIPSLALLVHLADGGIAEISIPALARAITWGNYLESHAHRIYASTVHSDVVAARCLAKKITDGSLTDGFSVKDVYRPRWSGLATREEAQAAIDLLIDLDWLAVVEIPTTGRKRTEHRINARIQQTAPEKELPELPEAPSGSFGSMQAGTLSQTQLDDDWVEF
jgi:putative DNA primase/helicase